MGRSMGRSSLKTKESEPPLKVGSVYKVKRNILLYNENIKAWQTCSPGKTLLLLEIPKHSSLGNKDIIHLKFLTSNGEISTRADFINDIFVYLEEISS
jgi:hypothetical protein